MNKKLDIVRISGERVDLCIRRVDDEAIEQYLKWMNDETIAMWISRNTTVLQLNEEKAWCEKEFDRDDCLFNIVEKDTRKLIGNCGCQKHRGEANSSLGICIGEADSRNKGYGTEVIKMLVKFAFEEQNAHRVELKANGDNARAIKCYENAGFTICGRMHEAGYYNGHYCDVVVMEILRKDWEKNK